ncbi:MAG: outer membrane protein assembly factor BamA [Campylobacteraceae bacterium]|jgi:outer membrane protein insertion porin family|nr:outer membrane protein assembly factor BamA [Campylobacteraceae bacterium]
MKKVLLSVACITALGNMLCAKQINDIKFEGLLYLSPETALEMTGLKVGQQIDIDTVDNAVKTLFRQQYFEDIWIEEEDGVLTIHLREKPIIAKVDIEGIGDSDKESVNSFSNVKKGEIYDFSKIEFAKEQIKKFYELKGFFDTVVDVETNRFNEQSIEVKFKINRGENIIIKSVDVHGADKLDYSDFEPSIANKEREFMGWMWGRNDGKVNLFELEQDASKIRDIYYKYGYLDANVSAPYLRVSFDNYNAKLEYKVDEGEKYKVGSTEIIIPDSLINIEKVKKDFALQGKDTFDIVKLRRDAKKLEDMVADLGYAYVKVYPDIKKDAQNNIVDIIYTVTPADKVYIRDVRIMGNSVTIDRVIRRDVFLAPKDLYNRTDLRDSRDALRRTGYFEDVTIKEERVSKDEIDLVVEVKERQTGTIGGGIGYGSSDGFLINAYVSENNLLGSGVSTSVNVERSDRELSGSISMANPRIFDSAYSLGGSIYRKDYDYYDYDELTSGFYMSLGRRLGRYISASVRYTYETSELSDISAALKNDIKHNKDTSNYLEKALKSSITPSLSFNNTDDYYLPRRGVSASTSFEFAGLGGDQEFMKSTTRFAAFYGLEDAIGYDLILRYKAQFGWIEEVGYLPYNEKLYLGGVGSLRGFDSSSISPKNADGALIGGKISFLNSVELSFPMVERIKMRGALFVDYGAIGNEEFDEQRASAGAALEWISPMGPIQFIFARPLVKESGDRLSSFEFTMGRTF